MKTLASLLIALSFALLPATASRYSAKIVSITGDKVAVDYDDYDDSWNETVGWERIQLP